MKRFEKGDKIEGFRKCRKTETFEAVRIDEPFVIEIDDALGGSRYGNAGEYLVREVTGDLYVCSAKTFEHMYEWAEPEPEPEPEQTPEDHLRSIQATFVEFGMREPDLFREDEHTARLEFRVNEDLWYRITCYELAKGGLHTIVTHSSGTLFEGYSRVRSFAAVQNHLAKHSIAVQSALGVPVKEWPPERLANMTDEERAEFEAACAERDRMWANIPESVIQKLRDELDPDLLSTDYGNAPSPAADKLRRGPWPDLHYPKSGEDS